MYSKTPKEAFYLIGFTLLLILLAAVFAWLICGCSGTDKCSVLRDQRDWAKWGSSISGGLAGAGGISAAVPDTGDPNKDKRIEWGFGITSAVMGATSVSLGVVAGLKTDEYFDECTTPRVANADQSK